MTRPAPRAAGPVAPGPLAGADRWAAVTGRAGNRCECRGGCGRRHQDSGGRCPRENPPGAPLHAVPRDPVPFHVAAALPADALDALCGPCHDGRVSMQARARRTASAAHSGIEPLF